jgi:hypothetical protein
MAKFKLGENLFWGEDNTPITITSICPTIKGVKQSYEFYLEGETIREIEYKLHKSDKTFPTSPFRFEDEVYLISNKRGEKPIQYKIIDIFTDEDYPKDVLYKCVDKNSNERILTVHNLSLYPNENFIR